MKKEDDNIITNEIVEIGDNIMRYGNSTIQLSNISHFTVEPMPKTPYSPIGVAGCILGILLILYVLITQEDSQIILIIGISAFLVFGVSLFSTYDSNNNRGEYLLLDLNSGKVIYFECYDKKFLLEAEKALTRCFKNKDTKYKINFKDCKIIKQDQGSSMTNIDNNSGSIITGNAFGENIGNSTGNNSTTTITNSNKDDWERLEQLFETLEELMDKKSFENELILQALPQIQKRDNQGLKNVLENNKEEFKNKIFCHLATFGITEIIKKLTGLDF